MRLSGVSLLPVLSFVTLFSILQASADGTNRRVLFLTNSESGFGNVGIATSYALVVNHADVEVHYASFPQISKAVAAASEYALQRSPGSKGITFHPISGKNFGESAQRLIANLSEAFNAPGLQGHAKFTSKLDFMMMPWTGPEYAEVYYDIVAKIEAVDPEVIVVDTILAPAVEAAAASGRKQMFLSANSLKDIFSGRQGWGAMFWKYPAFSSGYSYPLPWKLVPANVLMNLRLVYTILVSPNIQDTLAYLKNIGLAKGASMFEQYRSDIPWISPSKEEFEYPLTVPPNVTQTGPIIIASAPVAVQDPELAEWLAQAPTVLISRGSHLDYSEQDAIEMVRALLPILDEGKTQVLWKMPKRTVYSDEFLAPVAKHIESGRLRVALWIKADLASILDSGHVVLDVHHGGANCFNEALAAGVPHIVLPAWADHYDYAVRAEWLGIGIWASRNGSPAYTADELGSAFRRALGDGEEARKMRSKAQEISQKLKAEPGRDIAARAVVDWLDGKAKDSPPRQSKDEL